MPGCAVRVLLLLLAAALLPAGQRGGRCIGFPEQHREQRPHVVERGQSGSNQGTRQMRDVSEAMRAAAGELRDDDPAQASASAQL